MIGRCAPADQRLGWWIIGLAIVATLAAPVCAERPTAPGLLPDTTAVLVWVPDVPETCRRFMNTSLGRMSRDPQLRPLIEDLYGSLAEAVATVQDRIGLSLSELLQIPQGEFALALVAPDEAPPALIVMLDTGDAAPKARTLLQRGIQALEQSGATKSVQTLVGTKCRVFDGVGPRQRQLVLCEKDSTFIIASSTVVLKQVLSVWTGEETQTLAKHKRFVTIMRRSGSKEQKPHLVLYGDPIGLMRSIGQDNIGVRLAVATLPTLGLDGLKALGGSVTFDAGQFDSIASFHVLLDSFRTGILKMIALESGETDPERWVPADVANYTTLHWNFQTTFETLTSLYDGFRGEGALARDLERRFEKPIGLDFENDLLPALAGRVTHFNWIERPITRRSQATLVAFELSDPEPVALALQTLSEKFDAFLKRRSHGGKDYLQFAPPQRSDEPNGPPQPTPCFGVLYDYLVITDRPSLYQKAIATGQGSGESLADALDFKLVVSKIRRGPGAKPAMISFERPQEGLRLLYELAVADDTRQGLRRQAENSRFFKSLDTALEKHPLPPFAVLERYLAPSGAVLADDVSGLHYTSFTLRRQEE